MTSSPDILNTYPAASFLRRFGAIIYDGLLIIAIEMVLLAILGAIGLFLMGDGVANQEARLPEWATLPFLIAAPIVFYGWFWTHAGRTLGMQAWRIQVRQFDGSLVTWKQVVIRCVSALLGLANLSCLFQKQNISIHDRLSSTIAVYDKDKVLD